MNLGRFRFFSISLKLGNLPGAPVDIFDFDLENPPWGVRCRKTENGLSIRATMLSWYALISVPFTSAFSATLMAVIYAAQGCQGVPVWEILILFVLVLGMFILWWLTIMMICGKIEVKLDGDDGQVFVGIGPIGWTKRFKLSAIVAVYEIFDPSESAPFNADIVLEGKKRISFGQYLSGKRRHFVAQALQCSLEASREHKP